jgi:hypothetical protein
VLQLGNNVLVEYDEPQDLLYDRLISRESSIVSNARSQEGWRLLSSRQLRDIDGILVSQELHSLAEFWADGEEVRNTSPAFVRMSRAPHHRPAQSRQV